MRPQTFRRHLVLGVHLLLIYLCVWETQGTPVALPNQLRTSTDDEGTSSTQLQSQRGSENQFMHSDRHVQHRISHSLVHPESVSEASNNAEVKPQLLRDGQEHPTAEGQTIKNFSPASSDESPGVSMSTPDLQDGRNHQYPDHLARKMLTEHKVREELNKQSSGDSAKNMQMEPGEQRTDLQERINSKIKALSKNMDKSKRLSFFSVLHPALAAALSAEKHGETADIPRPPLENIEYSSGPLRGTESHDDDALHYPAPASSKQSVLADIQEVAADSHKFKGAELEEHQLDVKENLRQSENERSFAVQTGKGLDLNGSEESHRSVEGHHSEESTVAEEVHMGSTEKEFSGPKEGFKLGEKSGQREASKAVDQFELAGSVVEPEHSKAHPSSTKPAGVLNVTKTEEPSGTESVMKTTAKYWHGFVSRVKRVIGALRNPKTTNQTSKDHQNDNFTEDDVQDMVNEVVREIQMRTEGGKQTKPGTDSASGVRGEQTSTEKGKGTLLMLRTKTVVSSDAVADSVTTAAKKMLSKKGDSLSHDMSSKLLREVQDKLEELLQPIE